MAARRGPLGANVLRMPKAIVEQLCSPANLSVLRRKDVAAFLERLFRVGFGLQRRLTSLTAALRGPRGPWAAGELLLEGRLADAVTAFAAPRPLFPRSCDEPPVRTMPAGNSPS